MEPLRGLNSLTANRSGLTSQVQLSNLIDQFLENIHGINGCLVTEDGLIVAKSAKHATSTSDDLGVITASMLSVAERAVSSIKTNQNLQKIQIETSVPEDDKPSYIINIIQVSQNLLFAFTHYSTIESGLVIFELHQVLKLIRSFFEKERTHILEHIGTMI